ncbi:MAG: type II secretion system protein E [Opitutales bacterium TMED158]|nr:MAG: type II secretion system protein E [Opitutales bacterium TMED158]
MSDSSLILQLIARKGMASREQIASVKAGLERKDDELLFRALVDKGFVERSAVYEALASEFSMRYVDLSAIELAMNPGDLLEERLARQFNAFPLDIEKGALQLAISDPLEVESIDSLSHMLKIPVEPVLADAEQIKRAIEIRYAASDLEGEDGSINSSVDEIAEVQVRDQGESAMEISEDSQAPIIRLVQVIIAEAIRRRASDIHLEPMDTRFRVRYRIDGELHEMSSPPPKNLQLPVISRIKVMGKLSIAEKRLPQDGRIQVRVEGVDYDLRVSSLPTGYGESIVMRILDKTGLMKGLPELGFLSDDQVEFEKLISLPDGILLVTGPTGSGKTTTLYSCLNYVNKPDRKIITVEDPIEYQMPGINQVPVRKSVGMTFAAALKAMLRQAPNIIMVGEIRDRETAEIAINASLTGHMVFSTLHTNDAPSAITRLVDIGVKPYLVATSLRAAMAQRLVRRNCPDCSQPHEPTRRELLAIGLEIAERQDARFMRGTGCPRCYGQGARGRFGIFEIFQVNEEIEKLIYSGGTSAQMRSIAKELGMGTMREDGIRKALSGLTSLEEVLSVTVDDPVSSL